jgi:hypothetical protein
MPCSLHFLDIVEQIGSLLGLPTIRALVFGNPEEATGKKSANAIN